MTIRPVPAWRRNAILLSIQLSLVMAACSLLPVRGSGEVVSRTTGLSDFNRVVFSGTGELLLVQSGVRSLTVEADDNLMNRIEAEVRGGTLFLRHDESISPSRRIRFHLSVQELIGLDVSGIAAAEAGVINTERLDIHISGESSLVLEALKAQYLTLEISGPSEVEFVDGGEVDEQVIVINGPGAFRAPGLYSQSVELSINGPGRATVWASDSLDIAVSGIGIVDYYGSPQVTQSSSGNVQINSLGNP